MRAPLCAAVLATGCIIPDRDIQIDPGIDNLEPVRIVERAPRLEEMDERCNVDDIRKAELEYCPEVRGEDVASGLVTPSTGKLCICPAGPRSDRHAIDNFIVYAEDADRDSDRPKDTVYGVALLDPEREREDPTRAVAYPNYWEPGRAGELVEVGQDEVEDRTAPPVGRRLLNLWRFPFGNYDVGVARPYTVDLCNDDNGRPLSPGLHNLRFMVTDRPFFRPVVLTPEGEPATGLDGKPLYDPRQFGVPDLAAGATYSTIDYVFECVDSNDPEVKAHDDAQRAKPLDAPDREPLICDCESP